MCALGQLSGSGNLSGDEVRDLARSLYGWEWAEKVAAELGMDRKNLVREVASDEPVCRETATRFIRLIDTRLTQQREEMNKIMDRVKQRLRELEQQE